ncbi:LamG domain-containing protein [Magnetospirillum aberrantis]|uniref:LamG domain-containing protein n=1 Tax=Magnetospirillum aberrantis SpK TaxID=908842 RepID=A0A7C9UTC7_9PROT|nr:LamG domain-containing protein [Magnetospirillum aberrantis]NFV79987.1 LamG domain-containing protein [Magnetospirillum aberrantis SpK]
MFADSMMMSGVAGEGSYDITNSLLFRGAQYLTRTPSVAGNRRTFTIGGWVRRGSLGVRQRLFYATNGSGDDSTLFNVEISAADQIQISGGATSWRVTSQVFRDPTAWFHVIVIVDTVTQTINLYVNGQQVTVFATSNAITANLLTAVNASGIPHYFGRDGAGNYWRGYIAEPILIDGAALPPDHFGQIDPVTGSWRPKQVLGVDFGTNGFHLGTPWNVADLGGDASGQGNDWTPVGFAASDVVGDSPTNVFATLNSLTPQSIGTDYAYYGNGNTTLTNTSAAGYAVTLGSLAIPNSGKWAFKVDKPATGAPGAGFAGTYWFAGIVKLSQAGRRAGVDGLIWGGAQAAYCGVSDNGCVCNFGAGLTNQSMSSAAASFELLFDFDGNTVTIKRDGANYYSGAIANPGEFVIPFAYAYDAGTTTARFGGFIPSVAGYKNICTANLAATTGATSGTFIGNVNADGPCVYTGAVPETLSVNGNAVIWGTHADRLATGFKIRTASATYNASGTNAWVATYDKKPTVGSNNVPATAQGNP